MIVFPMVGMSRRFRDAGYEMPKYMLPLAGRTCFDWSVAGFVESFPAASFTFVMRAEFDTPEFVRARLAYMGLEGARLIVLENMTSGQAETVERALDGVDDVDDDGLFIFNIDTFRPGFTPPPPDQRADGYLEVFVGQGDNWSFIEAEPEPDHMRVRRTSEKTRISNLCSTGLYHFRRLGDFRMALGNERRRQSSSELYVAPIYNHLIAIGRDIRFVEARNDEVILCGVPSEYEHLAANEDRLSTLFERTRSNEHPE